MLLSIDYATPSVFESSAHAATLSLEGDRRRPVHFHGVVKRHGFPLRIALRTLGEAIWSSDIWLDASILLDPVITVHPDRLFFEAFSGDQSAYVALIIDPDIFERHGESVPGTTNIDFTAWLWGALGEMRSSRETTFQIGAAGMSVATAKGGSRFEKKVELPDTWVRGFLQVQAAMAMPGTRLTVKPVDLLSAIRFCRYSKARVSPRALRYEFPPGEDARLVLEPWEHIVPLRGAQHHYTELKTTRVWGRRRLRWIEGLLPFAQAVDIYLKGRALPSFYAVKLPGMTFLLGLTGFSKDGFTSSGGFDLLSEVGQTDDAALLPVFELLRQNYHVSAEEAAAAANIDLAAAVRVLTRLCRQGRCMFDVENRRYRHRELFEHPVDETLYFPPDWRATNARSWMEKGAVAVTTCATEETRKVKKLPSPEGPVIREIVYRDWRIAGNVGNIPEVEIVVNHEGRVIFGRCQCDFFEQNLLNLGPCEHMIALFEQSADQRTDSQTSAAVSPTARIPSKPSPFAIDRSGEAEDAITEEDDEDA